MFLTYSYFFAFCWICAGFRVPLSNHYVLTSQSLGVSMHANNHNRTPHLHHFSAGALRKILNIDICKRNVS